MQKPAIKGMLFAGVIDDVRAEIDAGRLSPERLEAALEPEDLAHLDAKIEPTRWYDIFAYHRFIAVLCGCSGSSEREYCNRRGRKAAERMIDAGIYQQLDYLGRTQTRQATDHAARFKAFAKDMKLLITVQASFVSFGDWQCVVDPDSGDRYRVEVRGVEGIPDVIFLAAHGMLDGMSNASVKGTRTAALQWRYERPEPDLVLYTMTGAI